MFNQFSVLSCFARTSLFTFLFALLEKTVNRQRLLWIRERERAIFFCVRKREREIGGNNETHDSLKISKCSICFDKWCFDGSRYVPVNGKYSSISGNFCSSHNQKLQAFLGPLDKSSGGSFSESFEKFLIRVVTDKRKSCRSEQRREDFGKKGIWSRTPNQLEVLFGKLTQRVEAEGYYEKFTARWITLLLQPMSQIRKINTRCRLEV